MGALREDDVLRPGVKLAGRYRIEALIGRGGIGEVYAATNRKTGRRVALKVLRAAHASSETGRRLTREAAAANAIRHPNVIDIMDAFEVDGSPVLVMELLEGEPLSDLMSREGALSVAQTATILLPVAQALAAAHARGIVHRDLKPDNIFLSRARDGEVVPKVLDFGIAKVLDPAAMLAESQESNTRTGTVLGTPHYMSFEQAMSEQDVDHRADVWSFGVIAFELLSGRRPFEFTSLGQMYAQLLQEEPPALAERAPGLPEDVCALVDRSLVKERADRLADMAEWVRVLEIHRAEAELDVRRREHDTPPPPARWGARVAIVAGVGAVTAAALHLLVGAPAPATFVRGASTSATQRMPSALPPTVVPAPTPTPTASASAAAPVAWPRPPAPSAAAPSISAAPAVSASAPKPGRLIDDDPYGRRTND